MNHQNEGDEERYAGIFSLTSTRPSPHLVSGVARSGLRGGANATFLKQRAHRLRTTPGLPLTAGARATHRGDPSRTLLHAAINGSALCGSSYRAHDCSDIAAFWMELIPTMGLADVILGTGSGAQNIGSSAPPGLTATSLLLARGVVRSRERQ